MKHINSERKFNRDYTTSRNGILTSFRIGEAQQNIAQRRTSNEQKSRPKPKIPFCFTSINEFKRWQAKLPLKIWNLEENFFSGKKTINQTKKIISEDDIIKKYLEQRKLYEEKNIYQTPINNTININGNEIERLYFPENSFLDYLSKQVDSERTIQELVNVKRYVQNSAEKICRKSKGLEGKTNEIMTALFYDDLLRKVLLNEEDIIKNTKKKYRIDDLSKAGKISKNKIRYWARKLKEKNIEDILDYKSGNNLLTYTDVKLIEEIKQGNIIENIKESVYTNRRSKKHEHSYANIARKFGLKDGRVVTKIVKHRGYNIYEYKNPDLPDAIRNKLEIA